MQCCGLSEMFPTVGKMKVGRYHDKRLQVSSIYIKPRTSDRCSLGSTSRCSDETLRESTSRPRLQVLQIQSGVHQQASSLHSAPAPTESQDLGCREVPIED
jgi:hypothetical protein